VVSGGSTLNYAGYPSYLPVKTAQFGKNSWRYLKAFRLELTYSKAEILALYSSNAPFGSNVVGLDAASWRYFGREPAKLSWGEMAALAVLPNSPSLVHPGKNRRILLRKRNLLLDRLQQQHTIDATTAALGQTGTCPRKTGAPTKRWPRTCCSVLKQITSRINKMAGA
jgi:penicillin-binding protein 1C